MMAAYPQVIPNAPHPPARFYPSSLPLAPAQIPSKTFNLNATIGYRNFQMPKLTRGLIPDKRGWARTDHQTFQVEVARSSGEHLAIHPAFHGEVL